MSVSRFKPSSTLSIRNFFNSLKRVILPMTKVDVVEQSASEHALHSVISGKVTKEEAKPEKTQRIKLHKYAMLLSYQGKEYFGMQIQKDKPTIEGHLLDNMLKLGWITQSQRECPNSFHFQRAARTDKAVSAVRQVCGMQLPCHIDYVKGTDELNDVLPEDIRVVAIRRATNQFHPQKHCDARTYSYTLPTFAFAKPHELSTAAYRITPEVIAEINGLLDIFVGTHNFFNYTSRREFTDKSCYRYITHFKCEEPFLYEDSLRNEQVEFITIIIKGQSFVLHQIRKMIGMVIAIVREFQLKSYIQKSFEGERIDVPRAPGLGLLLERVHYQNYDRKHAKTHEPLSDWGEEVEEKIKQLKSKLILSEILETELRTQSMFQWLSDLVHHDFSADPESEEVPSKSFVTMAAAKAEETNVQDESGEKKDSAESVVADSESSGETKAVEEKVVEKEEEPSCVDK